MTIQTGRKVPKPKNGYGSKFGPLICLQSRDICEKEQNLKFAFFDFLYEPQNTDLNR